MQLPEIIIYTPQHSPRLNFVLDWLLVEQLRCRYQIITDPFNTDCHTIGYGSEEQKITIHNAGLLADTTIGTQHIQTKEWNNLYTLYHHETAATDIPFDLLSGIFFLLSRYEEYLDFVPDRHGRFPHTASILYKDNVLLRPVLDEWVCYFRQLIQQKWDLQLSAKKFTFQPSYDIDIAWSYRHKGIGRWLGAAIKEAATGNITALAERLKVAAGIHKDPYDSFEWLFLLHQKYQLKPYYFTLLSGNTTEFDKNILPETLAMKSLIKKLAADGNIGIHPSYFTRNNALKLKEELTALEIQLRQTVSASRQHYIRLFFPDTYRLLLDRHIISDYSMGYSTTTGFRAGTSHSFQWYDLQAEKISSLRVYPFCFMDTTAHYDLGLSVEKSFELLRELSSNVQKSGGVLTTIFHNFSLGTAVAWNGWAAAYAGFIADLKK